MISLRAMVVPMLLLLLLLLLLGPTTASIAALNQVMAEKEAAVQLLVNTTQLIFQTRCENANLCVATKTTCTQPACGSNFLDTPGLMCDMKFGSNRDLCGKKCSGLLRSLSTSTVQVAPGIQNNQEAATFVCSSSNLTSLFRDLYYNQGVTGWQYVASNTGVTRTYPAAAQSASSCAQQDFRQQAWYVSASTGPKDILFVLDYSDSMNARDCGPDGMSRLTALKITMNLMLTSLTEADRFNVVTFAGGATVLGPQNSLLAGSAGNITQINAIVQSKRTSGGTTFGPGFREAFRLFQSDASSSTGCTRILMFLTDGRPTDGNAYVSAVADGQASLGSNPAVIFTYSMSASANEALMQNLACTYKGFWAPVRDGSVANNPVQQYYNWIAQGILRPKPRWTNPSNSTFGQGEIVTVSQPMFDYSVSPKVFIGVAAIDVLFSELRAVATTAEILQALKLRSEVCLDYDLTGCQRQLLRLNASVPFTCSNDPSPSTCNTVSVTPPTCNTTIITNINQVLCEPYNNYTVNTQNDTKFQCCQQSTCFTKSHSLSVPTPSVTEHETKTPSTTKSKQMSASPTSTTSPTLRVSATATLTLSIRTTVTRSLIVTGTEMLTATAVLPQTLSATVSRTRVASDTVHHDSATVKATLTDTVTSTRTVSPTSSVLATGSKSELVTLSARETATKSWPCTSTTALLRALNYSMKTFMLQDTDIITGFNQTFVLPPLPGLEDESLHLPWFEPFTIRMYAVMRPTSPSNTNGFALMPGFTANITLSFVNGLGSTTLARANHTTLVNLVCPPHPNFDIFAGEAIELQLDVGQATLGHLCPSQGQSPSASLMTMFLMLINTPNSAFLNAGQALVTSTIVVAGAAAAAFGGAAPDMQVMIMTAMIPCANSFQKRSFELYRAISPFAITDSFEGVLWGNLIANVGFLALHALILLVASVWKGMTITEATVLVRFPNFSLQMLLMTYPGTAFATGVMLVVFVIGYPAGVLMYIMRNVEASFDRFEYHRWRRDASSLRVRFLSRVLLPVGCWETQELRHRFGTIVTLQCRPEYLWITYPAWSPLIVAVLGLFDFDDQNICIMLYVIMLILHILLVAIVVYFKPFRSMIEDWFAAIALGLTSLFIAFTIVNLQLPTSRPTQTLMWVVGIAQLVLLVVRILYSIAHYLIIRQLPNQVPHVEAFRWNMGYVDKNSELGDGTEMMDALLKDGDVYGGQFDGLEDLLFLEESSPPEKEPVEWSPAQLLETVASQPHGKSTRLDYVKELYNDREDDDAVALLTSLGVAATNPDLHEET